MPQVLFVPTRPKWNKEGAAFISALPDYPNERPRALRPLTMQFNCSQQKFFPHPRFSSSIGTSFSNQTGLLDIIPPLPFLWRPLSILG